MFICTVLRSQYASTAKTYLGCRLKLILMQCLDGAVHSCCQPAQNPLAAKWQLLGIAKVTSRDKVIPKIDHGKFDGVP